MKLTLNWQPVLDTYSYGPPLFKAEATDQKPSFDPGPQLRAPYAHAEYELEQAMDRSWLLSESRIASIILSYGTSASRSDGHTLTSR